MFIDFYRMAVSYMSIYGIVFKDNIDEDIFNKSYSIFILDYWHLHCILYLISVIF